ncbi:MAG: hypothetical protein OZSIB_0361 [Candidatus Ozemobacter sibiricus]|uniref:Type IV fimbrial biogenesis protein PilW n=1 Tax=Candidatus Ozemobacter sibiricus TaxID=2268124 RepID=A0A367ZMN9_9BACT|nr:MAG: hypothetical protein OZSIB_0361 [Candidatus Ozemobacter sibiricus]
MTMVEALVMVVVGVILLMAMQTFFSNTLRTTLKGTDSLETIRAASVLLSQFGKDVAAAGAVICHGPGPGPQIERIPIGGSFSPGAISLCNTIEMAAPIGTITYSFSPTDSYVTRRVSSATAPLQERQFALPRLKEFGVAYVQKEFSPFTTGAPYPVPQSHVLLRIKLSSDDPRFPARELSLSSFFISSQMKATDWNYYVNIP